jgi:Ca2+/H+ antiporter
MKQLLKEIRHNPLLWLLALVPVVFVTEHLKPGAHTLLFVISVLAIVPLAALLSHATESVAARTGDAVGGLLNATLGNLTELVIACGLGMLFSLKTHRELFGSAEHGGEGEPPWPIPLALATLAGVTVLVALVSEVFVASVQKAAEAFGMSQAFVGFIVVALVGGAAEPGRRSRHGHQAAADRSGDDGRGRCLPAEGFQVAAEFKACLTGCGIEVSAGRETKTKAALELFKTELATGQAAG